MLYYKKKPLENSKGFQFNINTNTNTKLSSLNFYAGKARKPSTLASILMIVYSFHFDPFAQN